jgi:hypothetical protein
VGAVGTLGQDSRGYDAGKITAASVQDRDIEIDQAGQVQRLVQGGAGHRDLLV